MDKEYRLAPNDPRRNVILVADKFHGTTFPYNLAGLSNACQALEKQHKLVVPNTLGSEPFHTVAQDQRAIKEIEQETLKFIDYHILRGALANANQLAYYGEIDYLDCLAGGKVLGKALGVHRMFFKKYLKMSTQQETTLAKIQGESNDYHRLLFLRDIIHSQILEGHLGKTTFDQFDPFALISIRRFLSTKG